MDLEQQLRAALVPCRPGPELRAAVMARVSAARGARRAPGRWILSGTILVVAAAAAMLVAYLSGSSQRAVVVPATSHFTPATALPVATPVELATHPVRNPVAVEESAVHLGVDAAAAPSRTLLLRPLQMESDNPEVQAALREFYGSVVDGLRAVPGLVLLQPGETGESTEAAADFRLTFVGSADDGSAEMSPAFDAGGGVAVKTRRQPALKPAHDWQATIVLEVPRAQASGAVTGTAVAGAGGMTAADLREIARQSMRPKGEYKMKTMSYLSGPLPSTCHDAANNRSGRCRSPADLGTWQSEHLRLEIFPADPELTRRLRARVLDASRPYGVRFEALELLAGKGENINLGPDVIRAGFDLVASAPNPNARARVMNMLRGPGQPALVQTLVDMSAHESDTPLRLQALSMLIADYKSDPAARSALESLAASDPLPLVRQAAGRALYGDSAWNEYVVTSVKDLRLSPAERFAPLGYLVQANQMPEVRRLLDEELIAALVDVLPPLMDDPPGASGRTPAVDLLALLGDTASSPATDLMLASLDRARAHDSRLFILQALGRRAEDPRVRATLEKVSADDLDPRMRQIAAQALKSPVAPSRQ